MRERETYFLSDVMSSATQKIEEAIMESNAKTEMIKNKFVNMMSDAGVRDVPLSTESLVA